MHSRGQPAGRQAFCQCSLFAPVARTPQLAQLWAGDKVLNGSRFLWAARRLALGFAIVGVLKEGSRAAFKAALPLLYRFFPLPIRRLWQPPVHNLYRPAQEAAAAAAASQAGKVMQRRANAQQDKIKHANGSAVEEQQPGGTQATGSGQAARRRRGAALDGSPNSRGHSSGSHGRLGADVLAALPHNEAGLPWDVDVTSRFFAYAGIGLAVSGASPRVFEALGW